MSERNLYRFGAASAVVGGVLALVFNLLHPRTSDFTDPVTSDLRSVAGSDAWELIHLGITAGSLLLIAALYVVARSLADDEGGYRLGRLALGSLLVAAPVGLVTLAIDGYATKEVADAWAAASKGGAQTAFAAGHAVVAMGWAVFMFFAMLLLGITPILYGAAIAASRAYPAWLGWGAIAFGVGSIAAGLMGFFGGPSEGFFLLFTITSAALTLWVIALGVLLWRRADVVAEPVGAADRRAVERGAVR